jgi:hypothetical protein
MNSDSDEKHSKQVDAWIAKNAPGLPAEKLVPLFGEAIETIRRRALNTLSEVTYDAIFDRVLLTCQKEHPLLSQVKREPALSLDGLLAQLDDFTDDQIKGAFRSLLIRLLALLGNLTADILTKPLYRELSKVTADRLPPSKKPGQRSLRSVKGSSVEGNL